MKDATNSPTPEVCTAFAGHHRIASGHRAEVAVAVWKALKADPNQTVLTFDRKGRLIDLDLRGDEGEVRGRYAEPEPQRGRGRPKLGVVAREVTLLPRHWEWLAEQPGGASVALRRLVEAARAADGGQDRRAAHEAAYRVMSALGGDLPGFEEGSRALFADDMGKLGAELALWPADLREHVLGLASGAQA
ncbi:DUF2239 family protein [Caulobacter segnis]|uniref:DUF2239 family protein n=1 Tax=Caulobacter segnis TaxID=88688 RepID=UPI00240FC64F|nr:DUF2239 family protein [Caulobacter segnis]MDG2523112.1 DUF2239 family protein [Caulobacter segnis]